MSLLQRRIKGIGPLVTSILIIVIAVVLSMLIYMYLQSGAAGISGNAERIWGQPLLAIDAVNLPGFSFVVTSKNITTKEPLRIYVRNIGDAPAKIDVLYIIDPYGNAVLSIGLKRPVLIRPKEVKEIDVYLTYDQYEAIKRAVLKYPYLFVLVKSSVSGVGAETLISATQALKGSSLTASNVIFNITLVIIDCDDAAGWWVDVQKLINYALSATKNVNGLRIVEIKGSSDLYHLFHDFKAIGIELPSGRQVEVDLRGKHAIIIDAHGEVLPLPPQYVKDIDGDGKLEIAIKEYAEDIKTALSENPWILVTVVGAPLYYVSNNGFKIQGGTLYFNGREVDVVSCRRVTQTEYECWVESDMPGENLRLVVRGNITTMIELARRLTNYILTGVWSDSGPYWKFELQGDDEARISYQGKSWHNFGIKWGGAVPFYKTSIVDSIERFFGIRLPDTISAVRGVAEDDAWFSKVQMYLYKATAGSIPRVVLHYDDFAVNSVEQLDAGNGRNMPYWRVITGNAYAGNGELTIESNTLLVRQTFGFFDYTKTIEETLSKASAIVYEFELRVSGSGSFYAVIGSENNGYYIAIAFRVNNGRLNAIDLVSLDTSLYENVIRKVAQGLNIDLTNFEKAKITIINTSSIEINVGQEFFTIDNINISRVSVLPGFGSRGVTAVVKGPFEVYATNWKASGGVASAVFKVGKGMYIHAGYTPPNGVVKEEGYALSDVDQETLAKIAVYYPLYVMLRLYYGVKI